MPTKMWGATVSFLTIAAVKVILSWRPLNKHYPSFHIYCPILVQFGITDLNLKPSSHTDFRENLLRKSHTFLKWRKLNVTHIFPNLLSDFGAIWHYRSKLKAVQSHRLFVKISSVKATLLKWRKLNVTHIFPNLLSDFGKIWHYEIYT